MASNLDYLESVSFEIPDTQIPNFPQPLLFSTFVDPCGPALILMSHLYFTGNLSGTERDPIEQMNWLRSLAYVSKLAKATQQVRNKLAHGAFLEGKLFKKFISELVRFSRKKTNVQQLVDHLVDRTIEIVEQITQKTSEEKSAPAKVIVEEKRKVVMMTIYEPGEVKSLVAGHTYWIEDIKNSPISYQMKGRSLLVLDGKFRMKKAIFRSWAGTVFNVEFLPGELGEGELHRKSLRLQQLILLLD